MDNGYIKLHRKIVDWEWYDDLPTFKMFLHLLIKVNHKDQKWKGEVIKRGTCVTSRASLSLETGLSEQQVKTALKKLISTNDITKMSSNKNTLIIVTNYGIYQDIAKEDIHQATNEQPTSNQQSNQRATTNKNEKKLKNEKNNNKKTYIGLVEAYTENDTLKNSLIGYVEMRIAMKGFTSNALKLCLKKLDSLAESDDEKILIVNLAIERSWKSFFPLKKDSCNFNNTNNKKKEELVF